MGKILVGIFSFSFFLVISGLTSALTGYARYTYLEGEKIARGDSAKEYKNYLKIALLILGGSVAHTLYMTRLFFYPSRENYGLIPALAIAAMAFTELGFAIAGVARTKNLLSSAMKMLNLTSAFFAIVLTQVAILSFKQENDVSYYNAVCGIMFGIFSIFTALYMVLKYVLYKGKKRQIEDIN